MEQNELSIALREKARSLGLCDQWYYEWGKNVTQQQLVEKYLRGIDFCIEHDYPSLEFIKNNFPKWLLLQNGIFVDENVDASNLQKAVLLGNSKGSMIFHGRHSSDVYLRHQSSLTVRAEDGAKIFLETYDDCVLNVSTDDYSKVFVYMHGGTIKSEGNVVVRNRIADK